MKAVVDKIEIQHLPDPHGSEKRGEPCIGIRAVATVRVFGEAHPTGHVLLQEIPSSGLWGIEADHDSEYIAQCEQEMRDELIEILAAFGLEVPAI